MKRFRYLACVIPALVVTLASADFNALAVTSIPYFQNFQSTAVGTSPAEATVSQNGATTNTWGVVDVAGNHVYENTLVAGKGFSTIQVPLGPAISANYFEVSATVRVVSMGSPTTVNYTAGLVMLGATNVQTGSVDNLYVADMNFSSNASGVNSGRMRVVEWPASTSPSVYPSSTIASQPQIPNFGATKTYLLDVTGTYDALGTLTMVFKASDVANPADFQTYTFTDGPTAGSTSTVPRTGPVFGFYTSMGGGGGTMVTDFDNFSVIPEPASLSFVGLGVIGLCVRRRRSKV